MGLCLGMDSVRRPLLMMMWLPWRATTKPAFCSARTASRWLTPAILTTASHRDFDFFYIVATKLLLHHRQILADGKLDVLNRLLLGFSLRPTARQPRDRYTVALISVA